MLALGETLGTWALPWRGLESAHGVQLTKPSPASAALRMAGNQGVP